MRKVHVIWALFIGITLLGQVRNLTFDDIFNKTSYPATWRNIQHIPQSEKFLVIDGEKLLEISSDGQLKNLLTLAEMNTLLSGKGIKKLTGFPTFDCPVKSWIRFIHENKAFLFNPYTREFQVLFSIPDEAEHLEWHPKLNLLAYTKGKNVFFLDSLGKETQVTFESEEGIVCGTAVHRNEFGIEKGLFWSPDGSGLAFYWMDERKVTQYPLIEINSRVGEVKNIRYPMAGMQSHHVKIGVYSLKSQKTTFLEIEGPEDQYLTSVTWAPDNRAILVGILNRDQNHLVVNLFDAYSGKLIRRLFEEKNDKYVEPLHPAFFVPNQPNMFVWISRRDGYRHLYLYDSNGKLLRQLTKGAYEILDFVGFMNDGKEAVYIANVNSPLDRQGFAVDLKTGKIRALTPACGSYTVYLGEGKSYLWFGQNISDPGQYTYVTARGTAKVLLKLSNPLDKIAMPSVKVFTLKAEDGTPLYARMILPPSMDSSKKYPAIVYVYGGPHVQLITNSWLAGANLFLYYLAAQGYVVFTLDSRGSANRGVQFESVTFRHLGKVEVEDQMLGVRYLLSKSWIDSTRIGVHGWSFGGFMTLSMILRYPTYFKAAVAGGAVTDWKYYEVMYTERYMDTPETNPGGYDSTSILKQITSLQAKLLLIHGLKDGTVVPQHLLTLVQTAIDANKIVDLWVYPNQEHNVFGSERKHLYKRIETYFKENL
jgi:dipeptidyl-peptidase-4